ncbi:putative saccharopine dehydrogenase [Trichinella spiralis]|uniref:Saccharopine dehydrogenase n=1 Tax=Trichinella spiralis TaxID=6334 RepID=A0ABR3KWP3_TRISP
MIGSLGRGIRFGSKSGISAGRDPVNLCLCEPSQWFGGDGHEIFAPNFQLELELRSMSNEGGVASFWRNNFPQFGNANDDDLDLKNYER